MNAYNKQYLDLVEEILMKGEEVPCRTGNKVLVRLNKSLTWDVNEGFPILTFRQIPFKGVKAELSCFLQGITDKRIYQERGCNYWNFWCNPAKVPYSDKEGMKEERDLGNIYGWNYRHFGAEYNNYDTDYTGQGFDQLEQVINKLKTDPYDRRMIITAWDPAHMNTMGLPPCLHTWQFNYLGGRLHLTGLQRSADTILGVPSDMVQGTLLLYLVAKTVNIQPGTITLEFCNCHIYDNHIEKVKEHLEAWKSCDIPLPTIELDSEATVFNFLPDMARLIDYRYAEKVSFDVAV